MPLPFPRAASRRLDTHDRIDAQVIAVFDGDTIAVQLIDGDPANIRRYAALELFRTQPVAEDFNDSNGRSPSAQNGRGLRRDRQARLKRQALPAQKIQIGMLVRCRVSSRGVDGTLVGEIECLYPDMPDFPRHGAVNGRHLYAAQSFLCPETPFRRETTSTPQLAPQPERQEPEPSGAVLTSQHA